MNRDRMNCDEARGHWELYHDSEGNAETYLRVNEHIAHCPACAEWFHEQSRLEDLLAARLRETGGPRPEIWNNILAKSGLAPSEPAGRRFPLTPLLALAMTMLLLLGLWQWQTARTPSLSRLTAAEHAAFVNDRQPVDYISHSDLDVERYLQRRVSFPVRCPPRSDSGFDVRGAGLCRIDKSEAAYVVGAVGADPVSIFILPRAALAQFPHQRDALAREAQHHCREGNFEMVMAVIDQSIVLVIGNAERDRLERVLRAYGTYPHARHHAKSKAVASIELPLTSWRHG